MRTEQAVVDGSAVAASAAVTGLSSKTPNMLIKKSSTTFTITFLKNYVEAPVVHIQPIGSATHELTSATASTIVVEMSNTNDDFHIKICGSDKPNV